jgi:hypothetical protein
MEGDFHGHDGIRRWWQALLDAWPDYKAEVIEVRDLGSATLAKVQVGGHAADSGIPVTEASWHVWRWRGKKAVGSLYSRLKRTPSRLPGCGSGPLGLPVRERDDLEAAVG